MPVVRVLHVNYGLDAAWDASSQVATLPACNLGDANRQRAWRSTGAATSGWVRANFCSTTASVDRIAFVTYNFTTCAYVGVELDCTSCLSSASVFTTCFAPWAAARTGVCFVDLSSRQTGKKWMRLIMCDTGVDDGYYQVGVLAVGKATCARVEAQALRFSVEDPSVVDYAPAGTPKTWELDGYAVVELPHRFLAASLAFGDLQDVFRSAGRKKDMVLSLFTSAPACSCTAIETNLYGRIEGSVPLEYVIPGSGGGAESGLYDWTLRFRESL